MTDKQDAIIVDIDGTLALRTNRGPYDESRVYEDQPNTNIINLINALQIGYQTDYDLPERQPFNDTILIFVSGRHETSRPDTLKWLSTHVRNILPWALYMREDKDNRNDAVVKQEIYDAHIRDHYNVIAVFDDRDRVVKMWRSLGLTCLQVAEGDF